MRTKKTVKPTTEAQNSPAAPAQAGASASDPAKPALPARAEASAGQPTKSALPPQGGAA